jgi:hypothetical protein
VSFFVSLCLCGLVFVTSPRLLSIQQLKGPDTQSMSLPTLNSEEPKNYKSRLILLVRSAKLQRLSPSAQTMMDNTACRDIHPAPEFGLSVKRMG